MKVTGGRQPPDAHSFHTPINPNRLEYHLKKINNPREKTEYLVNGFRFGFKLGHLGEATNIEAKNSRKALDHPEVIEKKLNNSAHNF